MTTTLPTDVLNTHPSTTTSTSSTSSCQTPDSSGSIPSTSPTRSEAKHKPPFLRQQSHGESVWGEVMGKDLTHILEITKLVLEQSNKSSDGELKKTIKKKISKIQAKAVTEITQVYEKIWNKYDVDRDGFLSKEECTRLIKDQFIVQREKLPLMIDVFIDQCWGIMENMIRQQLQEQATSLTPQLRLQQAVMEEMAFEEKKTNLNQKKKLFLVLSSKKLDQLITDCERISNTVWAQMDENEDGLVSREDFIDNFQDANSQMFDLNELFNKMMEAVLEEVMSE